MAKMKEIKAKNMNVEKFIADKVKDIQQAVGDGMAINALSGGVDSSVVTVLGHRALGKNLKTYFIDNGIMREGEPARVVATFKKNGDSGRGHRCLQGLFRRAQRRDRPGGKKRGHHPDLL